MSLNLFNEWFARDTSKKIRAVFRAKGMSGKRLASKAPYGYLIGADGELVRDEETAPVVQMMFQLGAEGNGPGRIARILRERAIPAPGTIDFQRTGRTRHYHPEDPYGWTTCTVSTLLANKEYLGHTVNFKTERKSFKSKHTIRNPEEKQVIFLVLIKKMQPLNCNRSIYFSLSQKVRIGIKIHSNPHLLA